MYCFIGLLDTDQIFVLFDRIIGYNGLEIVAILAAAIFSSKADAITKCQSFKEVDDLFGNLYEYKVIECIRNFLW